MAETTKIVAILGITGRLGPALARAFPDWEIRGLSRRSARADEALPENTHFFLGSRQDPRLLSEIMEGAHTVIDCIAFCEDDAAILINACATLRAPPKHLIFASSIAECGADQIGCAEDEAHRPDGQDGQAKMKARLHYDKHFEGTVHSFILPRLVAEVDHHRREQPYLVAASSGPALIAGSGEQLQVMAPVKGVAAVARRLADSPDALRPGLLNVGPPTATSVRKAVSSLLEGAGRHASIARHPDNHWRGPHGGGPEPLNTGLLQTTFPDLEWPEVQVTFRALGAWLAKNPDEKRPKALVKAKAKTFIGHGVVDVHRRRTDLQIKEPKPELVEIADWLTPAFYIDTGRPCNAACMYCAVPPHLDTQGFAPLDQLKRQIAVGKQAGSTRAILIGGEPTIHPELPSIFDGLKATGLDDGHAVMTNGQKLADPAFVQQLFDAGVRTVHLSIDTADAAVYDQITRTPGRAHNQWDAFRHVLSHEDLNLYIYTCVTRLNAAGVPDLLEAIKREASALRKPPPTLVCAFLKPIGDGLTHRAVLLQSFAERVESAHAILKKAKDIGLAVGFRNLQACLAPELVPYLVDYYIEDASLNLRTGQSETYAHRSYWRRVAACEDCGHKDVCPGIYCDDPLEEASEICTSLGREGLL